MASYSGKGEESSDSSGSDETLDPLSPKFDPMKALYAKRVKVPVPSAKQFNNLAEFDNYMQGRDAESLKKKKEDEVKLPGLIAERAGQQAREAVRKAALTAKYQGPSEPSQTQMRRQRQTTVLTRMEAYEKGPMSLLRRCVKERLRVVVVVRAAVAVKSRCRGFVIGFDKHMNMALMDVDEIYLKPVKKKMATPEETKAAVEKLSSDTEHLKVGIDSKSGKTRMETKCSEPDSCFKTTFTRRALSGRSETSQQNTGDLGTKLKSIKEETVASSSSLGSSGSRSESSGSRSESHEKDSKMALSSHSKNSIFWTAYKSWAEQRCYTTYEIVERHVNQLFLRGDNVVSVILDQG